MAGRCLGELVRKMGDRVLQQIIPILVRGMRDPEASTRQGVCTGLKEVLDNISREQLQEYLAQLLPTVQAALCDEDTTVRQASLLPSAFCPVFAMPVAKPLSLLVLCPASIENLLLYHHQVVSSLSCVVTKLHHHQVVSSPSCIITKLCNTEISMTTTAGGVLSTPEAVLFVSAVAPVA